jgi:hypothetical protein
VTEERWEDLVGTGGAYKVSDFGEILGVERRARTNNGSGESTRRVPAHLMSPRLRNGRASVRICLDGQARTIAVSVAVLEAFVGPRPRGYMAIHLNDDATDCRLANLAWVPRRGQQTFTPLQQTPANFSKLDSQPANSNGWSP